MLALHATARKLRPLLVERDDFGEHTSFNSLRIIHGGLRYLQSFDLRRFFESVYERRWFLSEFPEFIKPLPCLMPLYGHGLKRNSIMRAALATNDILSGMRNLGVPTKNRLPRGRVVGKEEAIQLFPSLIKDGLQGAALWHDAALSDSPRLVMELLHWSAVNGADLLNYVEAKSLVAESGRISGLNVIDRVTGERYKFSTSLIINTTGPWLDQTAVLLGATESKLFWPSLAWNLWMDCDAPSEYALAVTPAYAGAPTYFLHPWKGNLLIGTGHAPWSGLPEKPKPSCEQIEHMLGDINLAIPGLELNMKKVRRIFSGLLPARKRGSAEISVRPHFHKHVEPGTPQGLHSVYGVKFTTSRRVAITTLNKIFGKSHSANASFRRPVSRSGWCVRNLDLNDQCAIKSVLSDLQKLIADEAVVHLGDLVIRRTDLWENPTIVQKLSSAICDLFPWDEERKMLELRLLESELDYLEE